MFKIMSNYYGWLTAYSTLNAAIERADGMQSRSHHADETFTVWLEGTLVYTAEKREAA